MIPDHQRVALFTIQNGFRRGIVREFFEGRMGNVFKVAQSGTRDFVKRMAIKTIRLNFASQKMFIGNLIGEARIVPGLFHAIIVRVGRLVKCNGLLHPFGSNPAREHGAIHAPACRLEPPVAGELAVFMGIHINTNP